MRGSLKRIISTSGEIRWLQIVSESDTERCTSEDGGSPREWMVRSHISWRGEQNIPFKGVKTSP